MSDSEICLTANWHNCHSNQEECQIPKSDFHKIGVLLILPKQNVRFINELYIWLQYLPFWPGKMSDSSILFPPDWCITHFNHAECQISQSDFHHIGILLILTVQNIRFLNLISTSLVYYSFCPGRMSDSKMSFASDWHNWHSN